MVYDLVNMHARHGGHKHLRPGVPVSNLPASIESPVKY